MDVYNVTTTQDATYLDIDGSEVTIFAGTVVNTALWDGITEWNPPPYQPTDSNGSSVGDPIPTVAVKL